ncbi:helix-turn-helix domain-containing protein [Neobacillus cucumis]|uniref:helix-turn-helix domain-containing protein n=1 Tax=Neobacillus cucumis TaxID=1740721 RepID=UPI002E22D479|nr:helix-turn-helix domain-containing protein [Neobacillus cucumis]MED4227540.1 helix-turn-helix domain-containing protein [Neobacillus cucumis]
MNILKQEDLEYICNLAFNMYKIPVYFFNNRGELVFDVAPNFLHNPLYPSNQVIIAQLFSGTSLSHFPVLKETVHLEKFFSISIQSNHQFCGNIVVGPVINFRMTEETINGMFRDLDIKVKKEDMVSYYNDLPVLSNFNFINMLMVIYYMIYQQKSNLVEILQHNEEIENKIEVEPPVIEIAERRQNKNVHTDISIEKKFLNYIKMGNKDELRASFHAIQKQGKKGVLSKSSYLRSQKNLAISVITLATRAAVEGGLFQEIAYNLSDLYIQKLEELNESKAVDQLTEDALLEFAERVKNSKKHKYSKPINLCQNYIFNHIYDEITLSQLAELTSLSPQYLSVLFKKEVGISIRQFIQKTKVDEAKNLLIYSNYSLAEISSILNFHDQSYFAKVFKKFAGVTPNQFKHGNLE